MSGGIFDLMNCRDYVNVCFVLEILGLSGKSALRW